jgi:hypothetical protein
VNVLIMTDGHPARGQSIHTDVVVASAQAFVHALNHLRFQEDLRRLGEAAPMAAVEQNV